MNLKQITKFQLIFSDAFCANEKNLNKYALCRLHNRAVCQDIVQITFMKMWAYLIKGKEINMMKSFLYHILNKLIIDEYRKHKTISLDVLLENGFEPAAKNIPNYSEVLDQKNTLFLIGRLPQKYQNIINMRYIQDLSLKEITLITGQSKNTAAVQLHRGIGKLRLLSNSK